MPCVMISLQDWLVLWTRKSEAFHRSLADNVFAIDLCWTVSTLVTQGTMIRHLLSVIKARPISMHLKTYWWAFTKKVFRFTYLVQRECVNFQHMAFRLHFDVMCKKLRSLFPLHLYCCTTSIQVNRHNKRPRGQADRVVWTVTPTITH